MRFDIGTLDSGERSLPFGLLVFFTIYGYKSYLLNIILQTYLFPRLLFFGVFSMECQFGVINFAFLWLVSLAIMEV